MKVSELFAARNANFERHVRAGCQPGDPSWASMHLGSHVVKHEVLYRRRLPRHVRRRVHEELAQKLLLQCLITPETPFTGNEQSLGTSQEFCIAALKMLRSAIWNILANFDTLCLLMPLVRFTDNIQRHVTCPPQEVPGSNLRDVLDAYFRDNARARGYVLDEQGALRTHMIIFINAVPVRDRKELSDVVPSEGTVDVMQALSGG